MATPKPSPLRSPPTPVCLLVSGFAPFGGESINPSWEIVQALPAVINGVVVKKLLLPTAFVGAKRALARALRRHQPAVYVALGQAGGRAVLSIERLAVNLMDAPALADNDGARPVDQPVVRGAPSAYFATVPVKLMVAAVEASGVPCELSLSAGSFVCNTVLFAALHYAAQLDSRHAPLQVGFIHVPYLPLQAAQRASTTAVGMPLTDMVRGVNAALEVLLTSNDSVSV